MPIKKFDEMGLRTPSELKMDHDCLPCGKITLSENAKLLAERKICYSDIDANGHTNNSRYAAFAVDALPPEYRGKQFTDFRINFSKEAMIDETLQIFGDICDDEKNQEVTKEIQVPSLRLDAIIAKCLNISRAKAAEIIEAGNASINHLICKNISYQCQLKQIISIRKFGRITILENLRTTRKDRIVLLVGVYH